HLLAAPTPRDLRDRTLAQLLTLTDQPAHLQQRYRHQQRQHTDAQYLGGDCLCPLAHSPSNPSIRSVDHNSASGAAAGRHGRNAGSRATIACPHAVPAAALSLRWWACLPGPGLLPDARPVPALVVPGQPGEEIGAHRRAQFVPGWIELRQVFDAEAVEP